jgi:hypothetical protein
MSRRCSVCNLEEHLLAINQRLRAGESYASLAAEYDVSSDSVERHARFHLRAEPAVDADTTMVQRLHLLWQRGDELFKTATATGDLRGGLDALARLTGICESLARVEVETKGFEALSIEEQAKYVTSNPALFRAVFADVLREGRKVNAVNTDVQLTDYPDSPSDSRPS